VAEEWGINVRNLGSTTFKRADLAQGFEPDSCFYIQSAGRIRGRRRVDLAADPPPDLVIEVDISSPSLDKLPIYAQVGVPEVWRTVEDSTAILRLRDDGVDYAEVDRSEVLPLITKQVLVRFLKDGRMLKRLDWTRRVREWAREARR
jgi:Uma2 family endonuclease